MRARKKRKKGETRQLILDAAFRSFNINGYEGMTIDDIASEVGITKGAIYYYFKSKRDLVISLAEHLHRERAEIVLHPSLRKQSAWDELITRLGAFVERLREDIAPFNAYLQFNNLGLRDEEFRKKMVEMDRIYREVTIKVIRKGIKSGEFGIDDPQLAAMTIDCLMEGITFRAIQGLDISEDYFSYVEDFLAGALRLRRPAGADGSGAG